MVQPENRLVGALPTQRDQRDSKLDFDDFFRNQFPVSVRTLMRVGARYHEAEEAVAQAMLDLHLHSETVARPRAYVQVAAVRYYVKAVQRQRQGVDLAIRAGEFVAPPAPAGSDLDERIWVLETLRGLPPAQLEVMALRVDGHSPAEIAELLGKTPQTVRATLREARRRLKQTLDQVPSVDTEHSTNDAPKEV